MSCILRFLGTKDEHVSRRLAQEPIIIITTLLIQQECTLSACPEMKAGEWLYIWVVAHWWCYEVCFVHFTTSDLTCFFFPCPRKRGDESTFFLVSVDSISEWVDFSLETMISFVQHRYTEYRPQVTTFVKPKYNRCQFHGIWFGGIWCLGTFHKCRHLSGESTHKELVFWEIQVPWFVWKVDLPIGGWLIGWCLLNLSTRNPNLPLPRQ